MATAEIVAIGSELLLGQIVDTNSTWMAQRLTALGVNLFHKSVVGDNPERMKDVLTRALERADVVITSGGLGPTQDDLTREVVAEVTGRKLVLHQPFLEQIEHRFRNRGFIMTKNNERQAYMPEGAIPVNNPNGTAPSFIVEDPRGSIFVLPGVPFELKWLFDNEVAPYLRRKFSLSEIITYRLLKVAELGESRVDDLMGHLIASSQNPTVGVLAHPGQVDIRIAAKAATREAALALIAPVEAEVRRLIGKHIFAADEETMETAVGDLLREHNKTIAVCEDLTGGMITDRLQEADPDRFVEGIICNSQTALRRLLTVSGPTARIDALLNDPPTLVNELALAVRAQAGSDLGLAVYSLPDRTDTSENLARGQTYMAITDGKGFKPRLYNMAGRGRPDRTRMSFNALALVRLALLEGIA
ncbi:MAG TPA: CinA family nicotinamide mononucleotide deamidase-related protein [Methylomirabilota bacterium]|jgi:nicotinamide-nucleotide amidase|nr:CinA family nicotinamide mononucleotide deamidase-related protein [Methylomirabilota bacterium]